MVFLAGVGKRVEGLVQGNGGCGGGVCVGWDAVGWVLMRVDRSGDGGLGRVGGEGLYAGEGEVAWCVILSARRCESQIGTTCWIPFEPRGQMMEAVDG